MGEQDENLSADSPQLLVPVTADEFARKSRRIRIALVCAGIVVLVAAAYIYQRATAPMRALESYDAGERLYRIARYTQAIISLDAAIGYRPDFAEAYLLRGRARMGMNDMENAVPDLTKAIELRPADPDAYLARGEAYLEIKNPKDALIDCGKAIELNPQLSAAYNLKGAIIRSQGNAAEALQYFNRAVKMEENLDNYLQRGATLQLLGQHKQAIADFDQAIAFFPFSPQAYFARANSKRALGDEKGAQADHDYGRMLDGK